MPSTSLTRYRRAVISDLEQLVDFQIALGLESENLTIDAVPCRAGLIVVFDRPQLGWYYVAERDARGHKRAPISNRTFFPLLSSRCGLKLVVCDYAIDGYESSALTRQRVGLG